MCASRTRNRENQRRMMKVLAASAILAGCLTLTCAQVPETIDRRRWSDFGANSQYGAWQYGFPAGTNLSSSLSGNVDVEGFFRTLMNDEARGNIEDLWTYLSYAHAECDLNDEPNAISVAYMFYVCPQKNGTQTFCPDPCGSNTCPAAASACVVTNDGIFEDDFQCTCRPGYTWDATLRDCVATAASSSTFAPSMTMVVLPALPIITRPTIAQFTSRLTSPPVHSQTTSVVPGLMQRLTWDNISQIYSKWRHGFPPGTSLTSLLPGVIDPDDYFDNLYSREANSSNATFWEHMVAASNRGELTTDAQLLSLAFIYFVCRETMGALPECPDPCGTSPCSSVSCTVNGTGLYSDEYECNCVEFYHWDPKKIKCVFCGPDEPWDDILRQCRRSGVRGTAMSSARGTWSKWAAWSDCSSECDAGTRHRRRTCLSGKCSGSSLQDASCHGTGFWLCHNRLLYASAATLVLLVLIIGALLFLLRRDRNQEAGHTRYAPSREQLTRRTRRPPTRRRPPPKPTAHPPTRQRNPNVKRQGQRSQPNLKRPPQKRSGDMTRTGNTSLNGTTSRSGNTSRQFRPKSNPPYRGPPPMTRTT